MRELRSILEVASASSTWFCETVLMMPVVGEPQHDQEYSSAARAQQTWVTLHNENISLHVGFVTDRETRFALVRALMGSYPNDQMDDDEISDGIGEMMNILAGDMKTRLASRYPHLRLGLPLICDSESCFVPAAAKRASLQLKVGCYPLELVVTMHKQG